MDKESATLYELCKKLFSILCRYPELKDKQVIVHSECGYSGAYVHSPVTIYKHKDADDVSIFTNDDIDINNEDVTIYK